jgi:hypothetical protein
MPGKSVAIYNDLKATNRPEKKRKAEKALDLFKDSLAFI